MIVVRLCVFLLLGLLSSCITEENAAKLPASARIKLDTYNISADGLRTAQVTLRLASGADPLANIPLTFAASGCALTQPESATNAQGLLTAQISSTTPGLCKITAAAPGSSDLQASITAAFYDATKPPLAGEAFAYLLTVSDAEGYLDKEAAGTIYLASSDEAASLPAPLSLQPAQQGQILLENLVFRAAGPQRLDVLSKDRQLLASHPLTVAPAAAAALRLQVSSPSLRAGQVLTSEVEVLDPYNNRVTNYQGEVHLRLHNGQGPGSSARCALTAADAGKRICPQLLAPTSQGAYQLTASAANLSAPPLPLTVAPAQSGAPQLQIAALSSPIAGQPFSLRVGAYDAYGNPQADFTGSVTVSVQHPDAPAPLVVDFAAADLGEKHLSSAFALTQAGAHTLHVAPSPGSAALAGESQIDVALAAQRQLRLRALSLPLAQAPLSPQTPLSAAEQRHQVGADLPLQIWVSDPYGNLDRHFVGIVQLAGCLELPCDPALWQATARFTASHQGSQILTLAKAHAAWPRTGAAYLQATVLGEQAVAAITQPVTVIGGPARFFTLSADVTSPQAGATFSLTLRGYDDYNNLASSSLPLYFSSSDANAVLPSPLQPAWGSPVLYPLPVSLRTAGMQTLSVQQTPQQQDASLTLDVQPAAPARCQVTAPTSIPAGDALPFVLSITDVYGNLTPTFTGNVLIQSSDPLASISSPLSFAPQHQGSQYFDQAVLFRAAGNQSLSLRLEGSNEAQTTALNVTLSPERFTAARLALEGNLSAGQWADVRLTVTDGYGNLDRDFSESLVLLDDSNQLLWQGPVTSGTRLLPRIKRWLTAGTYAFRTLSSDPVVQSGTYPFSVTYASPISLHAAPIGTPQAGVASDLLLWAADSYGNPALDYAGTVLLQSSDPRASLPTQITFQAADLGQKRLSAALLHRTAGAQSLTAIAQTPSALGTTTPYAVAAGAQRRVRHALASQGAAPLQAGSRYDLRLWIEDLYGNGISSPNTLIALSCSEPNALSSTTAVINSAADTNTLLTGFLQPTRAGNLLLTAALPDQPASSASSNFLVSRHPLLAPLLTLPSTPIALAPIQAEVRIADSYGNIGQDFQGGIGLRAVPAADISPPNLLFSTGDGGQKTTTLLFPTAGNYTLQLYAPFSPQVTSTSHAIAVIDLTSARYLRLATPNPNLQAGAATDLHIWVEKIDPSNPNQLIVDESFQGRLQLSATDPCVRFLGNIAEPSIVQFAANDGGNLRLQDAFALRSAGSHSLTLSSNHLTHQSATLPLTVQPASSRLAVITANAPSIAGSPTDLQISITDPYGNPIQDYVTTGAPLQITASEPNRIIDFPVYFAAEDMGSRRIYPGPTFLSQGLANVIAQGPSLSSSTAALPISAGPATTYRLSLANPNPQAGTAVSLQVTAEDPYGNLAATESSQLVLSLNGGQAFLPQNIPLQSNPNLTLQNGSAQRILSFTTAGPQQLAARLQPAGPIIASLNFSVALSPQRYAEASLSSDTLNAGQAYDLTIRIVDTYGNVDEAYTGTVSLSASDVLATYPSEITFTPTDGGVRTLPTAFIPRHAQTTQLSTAAADLSPNTKSLTVSPSPQAMAQAMPLATPTAGLPVTLKVWVSDPYGNLIDNFAGNITLTTSDANATLPSSPLTLSGAQGGNALLADAAIFRTATLTTLTANATAAAATATAHSFTTLAHPISYSSAAPAQGAAPLQTVDLLAARDLLIQVTDAYGNRKTDYSGTILLQSSDANLQLPQGPSYTFNANDFGQRTLAQGILFGTAGSVTLTARSIGGATTLPVTTTINVLASPPSSYALTTEPESPQAGKPFKLKLTALDANGTPLPSHSAYPLYLQGYPAADSNLLALSQQANSNTLLPLLQTTTAGDYNVQLLTLDGNGYRLQLAAALIHVAAGDYNGLRLLIPFHTYTFGEFYQGLLMPGAHYDLIAAPIDSYGNALDSFPGRLQISSSAPGILDANTQNFQYVKNDSKGMRIRGALQTMAISSGSLTLSATRATDTATQSFKTGRWKSVHTGVGPTRSIFAMDYNHQVKGWGDNGSGLLGLGDLINRGLDPATMAQTLPFLAMPTGLLPLDLGTNSTATAGGLFSDGSIRFWTGTTSASSTTPAALDSGRRAIALGVGQQHFCVILDDQSLACRGGNGLGALGLGDSLDRTSLSILGGLGAGRSALSTVLGKAWTCALLDDQRPKCWGRSMVNGIGDDILRLAPPNESIDLGSGRTATMLAGNGFSACAYLDTQRIKCWGNGGVTGYGDSITRGVEPNQMGDFLPTINPGTDRMILSLSNRSDQDIMAILDDTTLIGWGSNYSASLGVGDRERHGGTPETIGDGFPTITFGSNKRAYSVACGGTSCSILDDDSVKCFGGIAGTVGLGSTRVYGATPALIGDNVPKIPLLEPTPWLPNHLGPLLWLDALNANTLITASGRATVWQDSSLLENHLRASSAAAPWFMDNTLSNQPAVYFDSSSSLVSDNPLQLSGNDRFTIALVLRPGSLTNPNQTLLSFGSPAPGSGVQLDLRTTPAGSAFTALYSGALHTCATPFWPQSTPLLLTINRSGQASNSWSLNLNGALAATQVGYTADTVSLVPAPLVLGSSAAGEDFANVYVHELLIFEESLSSLDLTRLEGFLARKWALLGALPASHPFKSSAPSFY